MSNSKAAFYGKCKLSLQNDWLFLVGKLWHTTESGMIIIRFEKHSVHAVQVDVTRNHLQLVYLNWLEKIQGKHKIFNQNRFEMAHLISLMPLKKQIFYSLCGCMVHCIYISCSVINFRRWRQDHLVLCFWCIFAMWAATINFKKKRKKMSLCQRPLLYFHFPFFIDQ